LFSRPWALILLVLLVALVFWQRFSTEKSQLSRTALLMGTLVEIQANGDDRELLETAVTDAIAEMSRLEQLFSTHIPQSEINRLSDAGTLQVSIETAELLTLGQQIARSSQGAFDMCLGNLKRLWDIESQAPKTPSEKELREALRGIGPESLQIEGRQVTKQTESLRIDLGGIAKGYAVDRAVEILRAAGVLSAAVNAGGDIRLLGYRQGQPWRIGIQHPRQNGEVIATLMLQDRAVVTSGDYERYFEVEGTRYHHLFDPQTGRPARGCQSVTVVAADAASADALATAAFVLGPQKGLALLEQMPEVEGFLIAADGSRLTTSGLEDFLEWH
jgi:thiamine biosynthesis lipoprotein